MRERNLLFKQVEYKNFKLLSQIAKDIQRYNPSIFKCDSHK